ncbi:hypothetical protein C8R46DRAFT_1224946 [Mycena filopes]|nr:hypothetical protein C8R46DRAFT_1224946 [Mycena filopes]
MHLNRLSLPPAPLPSPTTSTTSYLLPLATPTASVITIGGADDLDSEDPTLGIFAPSLLSPTSCFRLLPPTRPVATDLALVVAAVALASNSTKASYDSDLPTTIPPDADAPDAVDSRRPNSLSPTSALLPTRRAWLDSEWWWLGWFWTPVTVLRRFRAPREDPGGPASARTLGAYTKIFDVHAILRGSNWLTVLTTLNSVPTIEYTPRTDPSNDGLTLETQDFLYESYWDFNTHWRTKSGSSIHGSSDRFPAFDHRGPNGDRLNQANEHERVALKSTLKASTVKLCLNSTRFQTEELQDVVL